MLYTTHRRKTKESAYVASLTQGMTDGLLLVLPRDPGDFIFTLRQRHFPYVLIDLKALARQSLQSVRRIIRAAMMRRNI